MAKPKRIGHLVLNVKDLEASTKFYTDILGFQVSRQRETGTFLTCGKIHHDLENRLTTVSSVLPCVVMNVRYLYFEF